MITDEIQHCVELILINGGRSGLYDDPRVPQCFDGFLRGQPQALGQVVDSGFQSR